jgi:hypothetical protein
VLKIHALAKRQNVCDLNQLLMKQVIECYLTDGRNDPNQLAFRFPLPGELANLLLLLLMKMSSSERQGLKGQRKSVQIGPK